LKISFHTFGCKCNFYDSNTIAKNLCLKDVKLLNGSLNADIHIINTCSVTNSADSQSRNLLRRLDKKNNNKVLIVTGCGVRKKDKSFEDLNLENNKAYVIDNFKVSIADFILDLFKLKNKEKTEKKLIFRTRAYVKVSDGCSSFCSYCIIPFLRGKERSRKLSEIISEIKSFQKEGIKEIVLTGINLGNYKYGLENLLNEILLKTDIPRIRLSSLRPSKITDKLIKIMENKRICKHIHLSLQSGSNKILKLMNRLDYKKDDFLKTVKKLRKNFNNIFIAADVIVGFPGEKDTEFKETLDLIKKTSLNNLHVFTFSPRPMTKAYNMKITCSNMKERRDVLLKLAKEKHDRSLKKILAKDIEVLWEKNTFGYTSNYYPVKGKGKINTITKEKVKKVEDGFLIV
jgi:threonylcarbamoyladenosine tRNA methylthiotransferase MtaB